MLTVDGNLVATWVGIGLSAGIAGLALVQARRANGRSIELAEAAGERDATLTAIELEHRNVRWRMSSPDRGVLHLRHVGTTPAVRVVVTALVEGDFDLHRIEEAEVLPDGLIVIDLTAEVSVLDDAFENDPAFEGLRRTKLPRPGTRVDLRTEWFSPAGKPDSGDFGYPKQSVQI